MAPTGIAAQNIKGATIHSFFGLNYNKLWEPPYDAEYPETEDVKHVLHNSNSLESNMEGVDLVVVDEISMLSAGYLEIVLWLLKPWKPVILLVGDFLQLPPVGEKYKGPPFNQKAYEFPGWVNVAPIHLTTNHRQSEDDTFREVLQDIRVGEYSKGVHDLFQERRVDEFPDGVTMLMPYNKQVDAINHEKLHELGTPIHKSTSEIELDPDNTAVIKHENTLLPENKAEDLVRKARMPYELEYALGARIVFLVNNRGEWVNGSTGRITEIKKASRMLGGHTVVHVELDSGRTVSCSRGLHEVYNAAGKVVALYYQFPFQLAWALTIHKCQGMTMDKAGIELSNHFAAGQTYVAVSRCRTTDGLYFMGYSNGIQVDSEALGMERRRGQALNRWARMTEEHVVNLGAGRIRLEVGANVLVLENTTERELWVRLVRGFGTDPEVKVPRNKMALLPVDQGQQGQGATR